MMLCSQNREIEKKMVPAGQILAIRAGVYNPATLFFDELTN